MTRNPSGQINTPSRGFAVAVLLDQLASLSILALRCKRGAVVVGAARHVCRQFAVPRRNGGKLWTQPGFEGGAVGESVPFVCVQLRISI